MKDDIKVKKSKIYYLMDLLCIFCLLGIFIWIIAIWNYIPNKIPVHYDLVGNIDRYGSKIQILYLPIISSILYLMTEVLERKPHTWNVGVKITKENQAQVYQTLLYMIGTLKWLMVFGFFYMTIYSILGIPLSAWFSVVFLTMIFGSLAFWLRQLYKMK